MTLRTSFKNIYIKSLSERGYKYCSRLGHFVKIVNNEFIYLIGLNESRYISFTPGWNAFSITGDVVSIYYPYVDKTQFNTHNRHLDSFCNSKRAIYGFEYNEETMDDALTESFSYVEKYMLPKMEKVVDYDSYIDYKIRINSYALEQADKFFLDSLVLIVADNHDDFMTVIEERYNSNPEELKIPLQYEAMYDAVTDHIVKPRDRVYNDPELLKRALEEARRRKENNLELLKSYKLL